MTTSWLKAHLLDLAGGVDQSGRAIYRFRDKVQERFDKRPLQEWEVDRWFRGLRCGLIRAHANFVRIGRGKDAPLSLFVKNADGLYVGLRREAVTQAATYVSLITDFGFGRDWTRFESGWMDVVVRNKAGEVLIYAENKASDATLRKLVTRLESEFVNGLPTVDDSTSLDDPAMKARHIWRNRPAYFWAVSPQIKEAYQVNYSAKGFSLTAIAAIPDAEALNAI